MLVNIGDVVDGVLVNAIALAGGRISVAVDGLRGRRRAADVTAARWFETYQLTAEAPDLPTLSPALTDRLAAILGGDEIQAALQELLAARLTDAPETDAAAARQVLVLTLSTEGSELAAAAEALAGYYDDEICALVARLEAADPPLLAQIRSEAFSARMINILNAIERHTAALSARPAHRTEASFQTRYRRHVVDQHGKLEPPDFDRRRRVPIADIYVPTAITEVSSSERAPNPPSAAGPSFTVYDLARRLDRAVLLGDPGGGKTTAANVLMHYFALEPAGWTPFLVTLRDFAAADPPERSVTSYIEHTLETLYQCPAPPGLLDLLLLAGRSVVIFDGLDELLDTSRRADVTTRIERFCAEYPLVPALVTSRLIGYDQARLDDRDFTCYRLGGFTDEKVAEYAQLWFAQDTEARPGDAEAFLAESASVRDLRCNPLMLSLMCILYRGEGSLPRDRSGVYEKCADLLFHRWDARRRIHHELRAGHLLEPALRHLGWWLFTRDNTQPVVTERELTDAATDFLHGRGFESEYDARTAAREFVDFCRGRMWVFTDAGTTATGERLYGFTHRTFLEYFAAAQLAFDSDSPEQLAEALIPYVSASESLVVAELAVQVKDRTSNSGAPRIYGHFLKNHSIRSPEVLRFLGLCLRSVDPSPQNVRELTRHLCEQTYDADRAMYSGVALTGGHQEDEFPEMIVTAWQNLLENRDSYRETVADEVDRMVAEKVRSGHLDSMVYSLRLAFSLPTLDIDADFWNSRADLCMNTYRTAAIRCAGSDVYVRLILLQNDLITMREALEMPGGPAVLLQTAEGCFKVEDCYLRGILDAIQQGSVTLGRPDFIPDLEAFGEYLIDRGQLPRLDSGTGYWDSYSYGTSTEGSSGTAPLSQKAYLGAAVYLLITEESGQLPTADKTTLGLLRTLVPYLMRRRAKARRPGERTALPDLRVPDGFRQAFRDWAEGRIDVIASG